MNKKPLFFFNAISAKKNSGGAFQVALNFIKTSLEDETIDWVYIISEELKDALGDISKGDLHAFPTQPQFLGSYWSIRKKLRSLEDRYKPDIVYTICAPSYFSFKTKEVFRYTNPWITNPNKYAFKKLGFKQKCRSILYGINQIRLIRKRKYFVTQTETAKKGILKATHTNNADVKVVPNVLPKFFSSYKPQRKEHLVTSNICNILTVSAPHPAKNLDIIPIICRLLIDKYHIKHFNFHLTINKDSKVWETIAKESLRLDVSEHIINHGYQTQKELIDLYETSTIFFLPTLIEVFSASILEATYFGLPILTTDFDFNKSILKDGALYYTPMNANEAADQLAELISNKALAEELVAKSSKTLHQHPNFSDSYNETKNFLCKII